MATAAANRLTSRMRFLWVNVQMYDTYKHGD